MDVTLLPPSRGKGDRMPPLNSLNVTIAVAMVLIVVIGCVVYQLIRMRDMYRSQSEELARVISVVKDF